LSAATFVPTWRQGGLVLTKASAADCLVEFGQLLLVFSNRGMTMRQGPSGQVLQGFGRSLAALGGQLFFLVSKRADTVASFRLPL